MSQRSNRAATALGVGRRALTAWIALTLAMTSGCFVEFPGFIGEEDATIPVPGPDGAPPPPVDAGEDATRDAEPADMVEPDEGPIPMDETCNGQDDDLDGEIDEGFERGGACVLGRGACEVPGTFVCNEAGDAVVCESGMPPGEPTEEVCNAIDDDCDGQTDERFQVGLPCVAGQGACAVDGQVACQPNGVAACEPGGPRPEPTEERCDGIDDDCDGEVDEGLIRTCDVPDTSGACRFGDETCDADLGDWGPCVPRAVPGQLAEICNQEDDDCDFLIDEEDVAVGQACDLDPPPPMGCAPQGLFQCAPNGSGVVCEERPEQACDGLDENCDGTPDDGGICAPVLARQCRYWLAWTTQDVPELGAWGGCPEQPALEDDLSCNGTFNGFAELSFPLAADVDFDDTLGLTMSCSGAEDQAVGDWLANNCRLYLGVAPAAEAPADPSPAFAACPEMVVGGAGAVACTSGNAGELRPLPLGLDLGPDAVLAIAFRCTDPDDEARAAEMSSTIEVMVGWADATAGDEIDWTQVCRGDGDPATQCASTSGDGQFHHLRFTEDVDGGDRMAIGVRRRGAEGP